MKKLAVIVPYRDRDEHLSRFVDHYTKFFTDNGYDYDIFIVEQDNDMPFNRGKLLNVGFIEANKDDYDYFCFHDVDMLAEDADYSYPDVPIHLAVELDYNDWDLLYPDYFGGVTLFNREDFMRVNGYSNEYWGWGFEDDDLLVRCKKAGISLDNIAFGSEHRSLVYSLDFDGEADYIEIPTNNKLKNIFENDFTISVRAIPLDPVLDVNKKYHQFSILSRPGFHTSLSYTSGKEFKAETWTQDYDLVEIVSDVRGEYLSHMVLKFDAKKGKLFLYLDGKLVETKSLISPIIEYNTVPFYLGVADPLSAEYKQFFRGRIYEVAMWDTILFSDTIEELSKWEYNTLTKPRGLYQESDNLQLYYDFTHIVRGKTVLDLSGNGINGTIVGAQQKEEKRSLSSKISVPFRRKGKYITLKHEYAGWDRDRNFWTQNETRQNQVRFFNEVKPGMLDYSFDGISTCEYSVNDKKTIHENVTLLSVSI